MGQIWAQPLGVEANAYALFDTHLKEVRPGGKGRLVNRSSKLGRAAGAKPDSVRPNGFRE
jgi:hypothetical protein